MSKKKLLIYPLLIISACLLVFANACEKDDDSDDDNGNGNDTIDYDITYGSVTDIDGNDYKTIVIGGQEWMAENLRVTRYNNGDSIPTGLDNSEWGNTLSGAYAIWDQDTAMYDAYGALYNWYAVDDSRNICPSGWHVPSNYEWDQLSDYLVNEYNVITGNNVGNKLKSCRQDGSPLGDDCDTSKHPRWSGHSDYYGTDNFGFSALPGGMRESNGQYNAIGFMGAWWTTNEITGDKGIAKSMSYDSGDIQSGDPHKAAGICIRCIKD